MAKYLIVNEKLNKQLLSIGIGILLAGLIADPFIPRVKKNANAQTISSLLLQRYAHHGIKRKVPKIVFWKRYALATIASSAGRSTALLKTDGAKWHVISSPGQVLDEMDLEAIGLSANDALLLEEADQRICSAHKRTLKIAHGPTVLCKGVRT